MERTPMSDAEQRIKGKVARILTVRELVLNRGAEDGVQVGMRFVVLNNKGNEITDPDTKVVLGSVELPKTFVKVISVETKLAVARTFREFVTPAVKGVNELYNVFGGLAGRPEQRRIETLRTDESRLKDELNEEDSYVNTGDPVIQILAGDAYVGLE